MSRVQRVQERPGRDIEEISKPVWCDGGHAGRRRRMVSEIDQERRKMFFPLIPRRALASPICFLAFHRKSGSKRTKQARRIKRGTALVAVALALMAMAPETVAGQTVRGHVYAEAELAVAGVAVELLDSAGLVVEADVTDGSGAFVLYATAAGTYRLRAQGMGYAPALSAAFDVGREEMVELDLRLGVRPLEVEDLRVTVRRKKESLSERDMRQFRDRIERFPHWLGIRIFDRTELDRVAGWRLSDVLRLRHGVRCSPKLYWNGIPKRPDAIDTSIPIDALEGVEFYSGSWVPGRALFVDERGCGVTLIWTRR